MVERYTRSITFQDSLKFYKDILSRLDIKTLDLRYKANAYVLNGKRVTARIYQLSYDFLSITNLLYILTHLSDCTVN
jgi:hypothetical protein